MPSARVQARIAAPPAVVYDALLGTDPARLVRGYGPLPRATGTSGLSGAWGQAGARCTVHLSVGSTAREELLAAERPGHVAYHVSGCTNALRWWAIDAVADWQFDADGGATRVTWTYRFRPRFALARLALLPVVHGLVRGYMRRILRELARLAKDAG